MNPIDTPATPKPPRLRIGCAMWANRAWVGRHYPATTRPGDELKHYVRWCTAVEGNTIFYALPEASTVARWAELMPEDFRFLAKLPRTITHDRRLRDAEPELREFCARLEPLGPRLGPVCIQLPRSFGPDDMATLGAFISRLPTLCRWAVELRHPAFFEAGPNADHAPMRRVNDLLARHGVERVVLDSRALFALAPRNPMEIEAHERKPRLPARPFALGPEPIVRFIGSVDHAVDEELWAPWIDRIVRWIGEGRVPTFFMHTVDNVDAIVLARRFHHAVRQQLPFLEQLPNPAHPDADRPTLFDA
jgi:uncharacterized protein YecE (DUF72 family)